MKEDFVTKETTSRLKEKGYPVKQELEGVFGLTDTKWVDVNPTIAQALKWLRDEKKIYIDIVSFPSCITNDMVEFKPIVSYGSDGLTMNQHESAKTFSLWDEAAIASIEYVLNNLI